MKPIPSFYFRVDRTRASLNQIPFSLWLCAVCTVVNESNLFNFDAIERQLAHVPQNRIRSAYNRAQYWDERVKMMNWYSDQVKLWLNGMI